MEQNLQHHQSSQKSIHSSHSHIPQSQISQKVLAKYQEALDANIECRNEFSLYLEKEVGYSPQRIIAKLDRPSNHRILLERKGDSARLKLLKNSRHKSNIVDYLNNKTFEKLNDSNVESQILSENTTLEASNAKLKGCSIAAEYDSMIKLFSDSSQLSKVSN